MAGCGGGGDSAAPVVNNVTVSPSLGKFSSGAHVTIKKADGTTIATADTTTAGTATINIGGYTGPLLIEVTGDTGVTYYDEGSKNASTPFGTGQVLRAIAPSVQSNVGVTAATHAAVEAIKAGNGGVIPPAISSGAIGDANAKIATALGISDVLQAPKLVDASTSTTLDLANVADKYALQLASLAKLASSGKTALDVAKDIALDLSDGKLDGQVNGVAILSRSTTYTVSSVSSDMSTNMKSAATDLGSALTKTLVQNDPTVLGTVNTDVTQVKAPSPAVLLAKAMFAELRTTLSSFANSSKTGFLDTQAIRASDDMKLVVAPEASKLFLRLSTIGLAMKTFDGAQTGGTANGGFPGSVNFPDLPTGSAWINQSGSASNVINGTGDLQYCFVNTPATAASTVTCLSAVSGGVTTIGGKNIKFVKYVLTPSATVSGQYNYTAVRENRVYTPSTFTMAAATVPGTVIPSGSGTVTKTGSTSFSFAGTLPPTATYADGTVNASGVSIAGTPSSGVDTIALSASKTALSSTSSSYALSGSVATTSLDSSKSVTIALDTGSSLSMDDTNATTTGSTLLALTVNGRVQTAGTKLTGTIAISGDNKDKSGTQHTPSSMVFSGVITDLSTTTPSDILTGKLETTVTGYSAYDATMLTAGTNYIHGTAAFTGTVQAPNRPQLKLVLSGASTGPNAGTVSLNYSYGAISITGSGSSTPTASSFTISNQDGIQIAADPKVANQNLITKASVTLATFAKGVINYVDGSSESFN